MSEPLSEQTQTAATVQEIPLCEKCGNELDWRECWNCGGECYSDHDCGEDTCCCLYPEDNVPCDICDGRGGWRACRLCYTGSEEW